MSPIGLAAGVAIDAVTGASVRALRTAMRGVFLARRAAAGWGASDASIRDEGPVPSGTKRNILFITVDQQRYDALGVCGGKIAKTPSLDALGRRGHRVSPRSRAERGVHAVAVHHAHRSTPAHARRNRQRHRAARGCAERRGLAPARGLPHGAHWQSALRSPPRPVASLSREPDRRDGHARPLAWARARRARHPWAARGPPLHRVAVGHAPRGRRWVRRRAQRGGGATRAPRTCGTTRSCGSTTIPTGSPRAQRRGCVGCAEDDRSSCGSASRSTSPLRSAGERTPTRTQA